MKIIGVMPCRNESWILGASLRAALVWCDEMVVLNHASTDNTEAIIDEVSTEQGRITVITEPCASWSEMSHRQRLLETARERRATHIAIVDADEILTGNLLPVIKPMIMALEPCGTLTVGMLAMWRSLDQFRVGRSIWANRYDLTLAFADNYKLHWTSTNGYDHHHREPHGSRRQVQVKSGGGVMHLQWCSWRRLKAKHARYKMHEALTYPHKPAASIDAMYSLALDEKDLQLQIPPSDWWAPYQHLRKYIDLEAEPWQERQCKEWMELYGPVRFRGLDLFGVV